LSNPGQQDAFQYGSAFSRGALIRQPDISLIQVSGTAAIDAKGRSLYPGDVRAQIDCTFDKIAALIGQEGADLTDIAAACVFIKRPEDARFIRSALWPEASRTCRPLSWWPTFAGMNSCLRWTRRWL